MRIRIDLKILIFLIIFYFTNQLIEYLMIMFFCVIHEIGHIVVGLSLNMKPEKIELMPFGLCASFYTNFNDEHYKIKEIFVSIAGPISSLALVILCACMNLTEAAYSNILILLFNLLPIYPLDGGRILKGILHSKVGTIKSEYLINKISYITLIIITVISSIGVYYYKNLAIFIICIVLWLVAFKEKSDKTLDILQGK